MKEKTIKPGPLALSNCFDIKETDLSEFTINFTTCKPKKKSTITEIKLKPIINKNKQLI